MKLVDRIIFGFIAVALGIICARMLIPTPVTATTGEVIDVNIVEIGHSNLSVRHLRALLRDRR